MDSPLRLPPETASVRRARTVVRRAAEALGADADAVDTVMLLASELATNAVLHARTAYTVQVVPGPDRTLRLEVTDASPVRPRARHYGVDTATGRGMRLVHTLGLRNGVTADGAGKTVWVEVALHGGGAGHGVGAEFAGDAAWFDSADAL